MLRQAGKIKYDLRYSQCARLSGRFFRGMLRIYAPIGTPPEEADEFAMRRCAFLKLADEFERRAAEPKWPANYLKPRRGGRPK